MSLNPNKIVLCFRCTKEVQLEKDKSIVCSVCRKVAGHPECLREEVTVTNTNPPVTRWTCKNCKVAAAGTSQLTPTYLPSPTLNLATLQDNLMATINGRWDAFEKRYAEMEKSMQYISDQYDTLVKELASQKGLYADLKKDLEEVHRHENERDVIISQQNARINQLEQASLSNTIEILGIPPPPISNTKENVHNTLQALATKIGAPNVADSVEDCYRVPAIASGAGGRRPREGRIVVRLKHHTAKVAWLTARKNLYPERQQRRAQGGGAQQPSVAASAGSSGQQVNTAASNVLSFANAASSSGAPGTTGPPIRIYEQLTQYNRRLLFFTRAAAKQKNHEHVWVRDGKIYVKHDSERLTPVIRITGEDDLRRKLGFDVAATLQT
jgi:hypothetical protein